jgi:hypothetical protein
MFLYAIRGKVNYMNLMTYFKDLGEGMNLNYI